MAEHDRARVPPGPHRNRLRAGENRGSRGPDSHRFEGSRSIERASRAPARGGFTLLTHPYSVPGEKPRAGLATRQWLKSQGIPIGNERVQSEMYVLGWMLAGVVKMMRHDFYRDYFLDVMDMMRDQYYSVAAYSRLSFGPGQRYASKECYLVQVGTGPEPELVKKAGWVIH